MDWESISEYISIGRGGLVRGGEKDEGSREDEDRRWKQERSRIKEKDQEERKRTKQEDIHTTFLSFPFLFFLSSNAQTSDLWSALEGASGLRVGQLMSGWTDQPGYPIVGIEPATPTNGKEWDSCFLLLDSSSCFSFSFLFRKLLLSSSCFLLILLLLLHAASCFFSSSSSFLLLRFLPLRSSSPSSCKQKIITFSA